MRINNKTYVFITSTCITFKMNEVSEEVHLFAQIVKKTLSQRVDSTCVVRPTDFDRTRSPLKKRNTELSSILALEGMPTHNHEYSSKTPQTAQYVLAKMRRSLCVMNVFGKSDALGDIKDICKTHHTIIRPEIFGR